MTHARVPHGMNTNRFGHAVAVSSEAAGRLLLGGELQDWVGVECNAYVRTYVFSYLLLHRARLN